MKLEELKIYRDEIERDRSITKLLKSFFTSDGNQSCYIICYNPIDYG